MVSIRAKATVSTLFLVVGALLIGEALNGGVVRGAYGVTQPPFVLRVLVGAVALVVGYRLRTPVDDYVATPSEETRTDEEEPGEGSEFDPELSPVGGEIEGAERADAEGPTGSGERGGSTDEEDGRRDGATAEHDG